MPASIPLSESELRRLKAIVNPFDLLYARVTHNARHRWSGLRATNERILARWLAYLVANFRRNYLAWPANSDLAEYFRIFLPRRVTPLVRLSGFVYLHVAHDLPLVIADSLLPAGKNNPPAFDLNRLRSVYMSFNADFPHLFQEALRGGDLGVRGRLVGVLPGAGLACRTLSHWVQNLRMVAWMHGEMLNSWRPNVSHCQRLRRAVLNAAEKAASRFWIFGLPIQPPNLVLVTPTFILVWSPFIAAIGAALVAIGTYVWWRYEARVIDHLGYLVYVEMLRTFDEITREMRESSR